MNNEIKIHILHTGSVIIDKTLHYHRDSDRFLSWTGLFRPQSDLITAPVSAYLIEHPKGLILVDTGWSTVNRNKWEQIKNLSFQYPVNKAKLPAGEAINEQLTKLGYQISDIDYVLMSHLHCDHADGLRLVKDAKQILVSDLEWQAAQRDKMHYLPHEWRGVNVGRYNYTSSPYGPHQLAFDLFGDGSIVEVWVPGHSTGLSATVINSYNTNQYVLLAADAGYGQPSFNEHLRPSVVVNAQEAAQSLEWVIKKRLESNNIATLANHDPEVQPQVITL